VTGFVLANGLMSSNQSGEGEIRKHGHGLEVAPGESKAERFIGRAV